jgi:hypothetical protein
MKSTSHKPHLVLLSSFLLLLLSACENTISPTLEQADPILVVDAWINNKPERQIISLSRTQPYFDNTTPAGVPGAFVFVTDDTGKEYIFTEDKGAPGNYAWVPVADEVFGAVGRHYTLTIQVNEEIFKASSRMNRVPRIDSITFDEGQLRRGPSDTPFYEGEFWSTDQEGSGDTYWIRSYKNGVLLNKPSEINIAYDAGNSAGGDADGVTFITPIRRGINANDEDSQGNAVSPFVQGDSVNVQINSITLEAFNYLNEVATQTDRPGGFQELFAKPLANVSTNITNTNPAGASVVGFFNVAAVSSAGKRFTKK